MEERPTRNILLRMFYHGKKYHGFALQPNLETVEHHLFSALLGSRLLTPAANVRASSTREVSGSTGGSEGKKDSAKSQYAAPKYFAAPGLLASISRAGYQKCGRTDAGVSAAAQYVSLFLPWKYSGTEKTVTGAYPYDRMLNRYLPRDIRITGWQEVPESFGARFSCMHREYTYYFIRSALDIDRMRSASLMLRGTHWLGRLSKKQKQKKGAEAPRAIRTIDTIEFAQLDSSPGFGADVYTMKIRARSFLHNQVRKIFALLREVGRGQQVPIPEILDPESAVRYSIPLADPECLVLSQCAFQDTDVAKMHSSDPGTVANMLVERALLEAHVLGEISNMLWK